MEQIGTDDGKLQNPKFFKLCVMRQNFFGHLLGCWQEQVFVTACLFEEGGKRKAECVAMYMSFLWKSKDNMLEWHHKSSQEMLRDAKTRIFQRYCTHTHTCTMFGQQKIHFEPKS